ncbi:MAG: hypothetical protein QW717_03665 [Candidatus Bathyarchaeia archaeon]
MKSLGKGLILMLAVMLLLQSAYLPVHKIAFGSSNMDFVIENFNVRSSAGTSIVYPGSGRVNLKFEASYRNSTSARNVFGWLKLDVEGIGFSVGSGACSPARLLNGSIAEEVSLGMVVTFEYLLDISATVKPDTYTLELNITYLKGGSFTFEVYPVNLTVKPYPPVSFRVVSAYFSPAAYPGCVDTNLYAVLENNGSTINSAYFNVTFPEGFNVRSPRAVVGRVEKGDQFTLTFTGISIPSNVQGGTWVAAEVYCDCSARTDDGVAYSNSTFLYLPVMVETPPLEEPVMVASVNTLYNGASAWLLPSARDVVLRVYLVNRMPDATLSAMIVNAGLPEKFKVRGVSGTYVNGMAPGGTCFVDLTVDVDSDINVTKRYVGLLNITYLRIVSGASFLMNQTVAFPINVVSPHGFISELAFVEAYWGYPDPAPVYSGSRYAPLTVRLSNIGRYSVLGVVVKASSPQLAPVKDSEACAATLSAGGSCTAVLYFDVNTDSSAVSLSVSVSYIFAEFGANIRVVRDFAAYLPVEGYPASESILSLVNAGWQDDLYVFPKTSNATYQVTLANRAPYSISGLNLKLKLPAGFSSKGKSEASAYVEGPVRSLAAFTASFTLSVGNLPSGKYNANLTVDCIMLSGGPGVRRVQEFKVNISVNDDGSALELVDSRWYEGSVGPNTFGAHLITIVRNVYVDGLRGAVLEIDLPEGMYGSTDNSSRVKATPLSMQFSMPLEPQSLSEILNAFLNVQQAGPTQVYGRGDILTFTVSLNLFNVKLGRYTLNAQLSYIDFWGGSRTLKLSIPVAVLGKAGYIEIALDKSLSVRSRYANTSLTLINHGTSPVYDAYLVVSPVQGAPILIASPMVTYIEKISPGEKCTRPLMLAYNPLGFYLQTGAASYVTYGPVPIMVSVVYRDAAGYYRSFNNSLTVIVEPFIELSLRNIKATGTSLSSTVTGILVNYGSSTAYRVEVEVKIGDAVQSSLIGDVEPGGEVAFRVDLIGYGETAVLTVKYYNIFNERELKESRVNVVRQEEAVTPPAKPEEWPFERWVIVAGVIVFLAIATFMIYKMMKKSRLPVNPEA